MQPKPVEHALSVTHKIVAVVMMIGTAVMSSVGGFIVFRAMTDMRLVELEKHTENHEVRIVSMETIGHPDHERRITKLETRLDTTEKNVSEIKAKLDVVVSILDRIEKKMDAVEAKSH